MSTAFGRSRVAYSVKNRCQSHRLAASASGKLMGRICQVYPEKISILLIVFLQVAPPRSSL
jgi:hypothetical protein